MQVTTFFKRSTTLGAESSVKAIIRLPILLHRFETTGGNWLQGGGARLQLSQSSVLPGQRQRTYMCNNSNSVAAVRVVSATLPRKSSASKSERRPSQLWSATNQRLPAAESLTRHDVVYYSNTLTTVVRRGPRLCHRQSEHRGPFDKRWNCESRTERSGGFSSPPPVSPAVL